MAPKLNFILANRFNEALDRLLGMEGEPGMDTLSPELGGVIVLSNDRAELMALQGDRLAVGVAGNIAAVAGQFGFNYLFNPQNSGVIATVEAAFFDPTTTQIMSVTYATGTLGSVNGNVAFRDSRLAGVNGFSGTAKPSLQMLVGTNGAITGLSAWRYAVTAVTANQLTPWNPVVLHPNNGVFLWDGVVNEAIQISGWAWRERPARPEELQLNS